MIDLDTITDEDRDFYSRFAQTLTKKEREAFEKHVQGWHKINDGPWRRTLRHGTLQRFNGGVIYFVHGNTVNSLETKGLVNVERVRNHILQVFLTEAGEMMAALEFGIDMTPPEN